MLPWRKMTKDTEERVWMCICTERNMGHGPKVDMLLNTPPQNQGGGGGSEALSLSICNRCCSRVCALVKKSATCSSEGTY